MDVDGRVHFVVGGLTYDVNSRISLSLDYQEQLAHDAVTASNFAPSKVYYMHLEARF